MIKSKAYMEKRDELILMAKTLFELTIDNDERFMNLIQPRLKNWEPDRLATIDVILLKMALTEFFEFETIPVRVTLNEYIDIAKEYSTARSGDFINGVLDKIAKAEMEKNTIVKRGRGLKEKRQNQLLD